MDLTCKIGGAQGEGIDSMGEVFALTLHRVGYYIFAHRYYQSLIKGGHTNYKVRAGTGPMQNHGDTLDILVALDELTIRENGHELAPGSVLVYDAALPEPTGLPAGVVLCPVPLAQIARELGSPIIKNVVAVGAAAGLLGLGTASVAAVLEERFAGKGDEVLELNRRALEAGSGYVTERGWRSHRGLPQLEEVPRSPSLFISGNEAMALGAVAGGCRFLAAYPITPATEIMYRMIKHLKETGGAVLQAEDELAAINMAIGAGYTGVRAMTSTSGPGFSLMMEALGLAGIAEIPVVIVNVQRGGPSTGLPTKTEQGDLNEMLYGAHGDIERIVLAPSTVEECFLFAAEAFNLAERFQCPVILSSDMYLGQSRASSDGLPYDEVAIERGALLTAEDLAQTGAKEFRRYRVTESGISPRSIPGQASGRYVALGNEHDELGYEIEDTATRLAQVQKRRRKLAGFDPLGLGLEYEGPEEPEILLVGWGSTRGSIGEARRQLAAEGIKTAHMHLGLLAPFPTEWVSRHMAPARRVVVVEQAITGQLAALIKQHVGGHEKIHSYCRYDGTPIVRADVVGACKEVLANAVAR
ncbi:MAG: 2-oxoacid:acceptor oxidoreductase subunit alpha [Bacillota bacterium]